MTDEELVVRPYEPAQVRFWLPFARLCAWLPINVWGRRVRVRGAYRVPRKGGLLILCNHRSDFDPVIVQYATPRPVRYLAKRELFDMKGWGPLMWKYGAFPVRRGEPDRKALKNTAMLLRAGEAVVVFPEGQLSETGEFQEIKPGVALILKMVPDTPVICMGLENTEGVIPYGALVPRLSPRPVKVEWGEVRTFPAGFEVEEFLTWTEAQLRELGGYSKEKDD